MKYFSKNKTLKTDLDQESPIKMHAKLNLNLQPVKCTYHLGPKTYYINIVVLGIVKNLFQRYITIFVYMFFL